jgi:CRP-like cAMP-binding protein
MIPKPSDPPFFQSRLFSCLSKEECGRLERVSTVVHLEQRDRLVTRGEPIEATYFPLSAVTSTLVELPEGHTIEVGVMGAEGFVGLSLLTGRRRSNSTVIVQVPGDALKVPADEFERQVVAADGQLKVLLARYADAFFEVAAQAAACNGNHADEQRLARWLLMVHDRVCRKEFPLTPDFLGSMLGVHFERVISAVSTLTRAGAIQYDYVDMRVIDRERLLEASCRCYGTIVKAIDEVFRPFAAA